MLPVCAIVAYSTQVLQEIGQKKAFAEQQLSIVKQQKAVNSRESRMLQLTASEVESLPKDTKVYEGVGKMYVLARFVCSIPHADLCLGSSALLFQTYRRDL